jgi:hypothetical protein
MRLFFLHSCFSGKSARQERRYLMNNKSFQTPPYIKKERADHQERKAKLAAIKALKATKKKKKKKKETKKSRQRKSQQKLKTRNPQLLNFQKGSSMDLKRRKKKKNIIVKRSMHGTSLSAEN